jgi:hypothetical protein
MSKRPTAKQAANEPYWFAENQEVSKAVTQMTDPNTKSNLMARKRTSSATALSLLCGAMIVGCQSKPL